MLLKAAGLCGKEINASEIMKHKASEVKELFHSGRKKTKPITNGFKMSLSCVYDKWRIKQIGWVGSLGRDKMAEYSDPPFFSPGQPTRKVFECLSGVVGETEPGTKARQGMLQADFLFRLFCRQRVTPLVFLGCHIPLGSPESSVLVRIGCNALI